VDAADCSIHRRRRDSPRSQPRERANADFSQGGRLRGIRACAGGGPGRGAKASAKSRSSASRKKIQSVPARTASATAPFRAADRPMAPRVSSTIVWTTSEKGPGEAAIALWTDCSQSRANFSCAGPTGVVMVHFPGRQGRQPMRAAARIAGNRSRWSLIFVKNLTILVVRSPEGCSPSGSPSEDTTRRRGKKTEQARCRNRFRRRACRDTRGYAPGSVSTRTLCG